MNRKPVRKLALAKETLRRLEKEDLRQARGEGVRLGGDETTEEWSSCPPCDN